MGFKIGGMLRKLAPLATGFATGGLGGLALGGLSLYQGQKQQNKADKLNQQALAYQQQRDAMLAPVREAGIRRLTTAQRPDLSSDFQSANPFARPLKRIG